MEHRREDNGEVIIRKAGNSFTVTGVSIALILACISLVFTFGISKEKIDRLESGYQYISVKLDGVSGKVDRLDGKMDLLISRIEK